MAAGIPQPEPSTSDPVDLPDDVPESLVRVPRRRLTTAPVPVAIRRGDQSGPSRSWTPVGTLDSGVLADVDPAGLVNMVGRSWSLDWWIGAEDRWHHPSSEAVRQRPLDGSPVLQTSLAVPGGDIVHRVGGVQSSAGDWSGPAVLVEVENSSAVPVALALVIRPWLLDGAGEVSEVHPGNRAKPRVPPPAGNAEQFTVTAPTSRWVGAPEQVLLISHPVLRCVTGSRDQVALDLAAGTDSAAAAFAGAAARHGGDLEVAMVLPLVHGAVVRVLLPAPVPTRPRGLRRRQAAKPALAWHAPELDRVAAGWATHAGSDARVVGPVSAWDDLVSWSANMIRLAGPGAVTRALDPHVPAHVAAHSGARLAAVAEALAGLGAEEANGAVAAALARAQRFSGVVEPADSSDATAAFLWSAGTALLSAHGEQWSEELLGAVAKAVRRLGSIADTADSATSRTGDPAGITEIGGVPPRRCAAALRHAASGLVAVGQPGVAEDALAAATRLHDEQPDPVAAMLVQHGPVSAFGAAVLDRELIAQGNREGIERLVQRLPSRRAAGVADLDGPDATVGFDVAELAQTRLAVLDAMAVDEAPGPVLLPVWPAEWSGRAVEGHDLPTTWGRLSFALRWHGTRPALLWEVVPQVGTAEGGATPLLRAPGLDPRWSAHGWSGEALLAESPSSSRGPGRASGGVPAPEEGRSFT